MDLIPRGFIFDDFFNDLLPEKPKRFVPDMKCDIYEKDNKYFLELSVPGVNKENINIECKDGYLTVTAEHKEENEDKTKNYIRKERSYGKSQRSFYVGDVEVDDIKAEFKDGILNIAIPKAEEKLTSKKITIE